MLATVYTLYQRDGNFTKMSKNKKNGRGVVFVSENCNEKKLVVGSFFIAIRCNQILISCGSQASCYFYLKAGVLDV